MPGGVLLPECSFKALREVLDSALVDEASMRGLENYLSGKIPEVFLDAGKLGPKKKGVPVHGINAFVRYSNDHGNKKYGKFEVMLFLERIYSSAQESQEHLTALVAGAFGGYYHIYIDEEGSKALAEFCGDSAKSGFRPEVDFLPLAYSDEREAKKLKWRTATGEEEIFFYEHEVKVPYEFGKKLENTCKIAAILQYGDLLLRALKGKKLSGEKMDMLEKRRYLLRAVCELVKHSLNFSDPVEVIREGAKFLKDFAEKNGKRVFCDVYGNVPMRMAEMVRRRRNKELLSRLASFPENLDLLNEMYKNQNLRSLAEKIYSDLSTGKLSKWA